MHLLTTSCTLLLLCSFPCFLLKDSPQSDGFPSGQMAPLEAAEFDGTLYASCKMKPSSKLAKGQPMVYGQVLFRQNGANGLLQMAVKLKGFPADKQGRALHIHQFGDLSDGCDSTGGHYNPHKVNHPDHPGDYGNFTPRGGRIHEQRTTEATLFGPLSVLGRAVVLHEKEDDLGQGGDAGSLLHGNAGPRLACCVIGISTRKLWDNASRLPQKKG